MSPSVAMARMEGTSRIITPSSDLVGNIVPVLLVYIRIAKPRCARCVYVVDMVVPGTEFAI